MPRACITYSKKINTKYKTMENSYLFLTNSATFLMKLLTALWMQISKSNVKKNERKVIRVQQNQRKTKDGKETKEKL